MAGTWPTYTSYLSTNRLDSDADNLGGIGTYSARKQLYGAVAKLNQILLAVDSGANVYTSDYPPPTIGYGGILRGRVESLTGTQYTNFIWYTGFTGYPHKFSARKDVDTPICSPGKLKHFSVTIPTGSNNMTTGDAYFYLLVNGVSVFTLGPLPFGTNGSLYTNAEYTVVPGDLVVLKANLIGQGTINHCNYSVSII